MAAKPPNDWWQVKYHTNAISRAGTQVNTGVMYVEAPDAATAKKKVEAAKGLQPAMIDSVSGPMSPHAKDMAVGGNPVTGAVNLAKGAVSGVTDFLTRLTNPHTWIRVGEFVIGAALLMIGLNALLHNPAGKAASVLPAGRIAKVMKLWLSPRA